MSGHSKWSQIKHKKGVTDKKRGQVFGKILRAIRIAAKDESNPEFNPRLRTVIEKAKEAQVPQENIERALKQTENKDLEEIIIEAYGPAGSAIIIEAITDNRNRTINEIKAILSNEGAKFADPGSVKWAFDLPKPGELWQPKFKQALNEEDKTKLYALVQVLEEYEDTQKVSTNA
ncbi:MAG: hypothetical protein A3F99_00900 [Candidatus Colwellbacteria bacterium RIFCSPLOWO2_12_FULL_43_11]|uniref:Transcriptional regulator n=1 Tax=Candidatus Colwellbacteria bacterium RIFCSPLOWO2_12_FULL_43_11 TaxID=1797693 RepID=A0A1G1ZBE8_9BACT|nr:MAG: hypothetical protein A3F99_00900 [Candidatus Colwellbacteria bacterium RIFCSPLOWO2_12_FULL_43_11]